LENINEIYVFFKLLLLGYEMDASYALDYLMLSASDRIDYRVERGITIKEWYESLIHSKIDDSDPPEVYNLVPVAKLWGLVKEKNWHMKRTLFDKFFDHLYHPFVNRNKRYVTIRDTAEMIYEIRKREEMLKWPTFEDLNIKTGLNLSESGMQHLFGDWIREGYMEAVLVGNYHEGGRKGKQKWRISPYEFRRVTELVKGGKNPSGRVMKVENYIQNREGFMTIAEITTAMGNNSRAGIANRIKAGEEFGILHPVLFRIGRRGRKARALPISEADRFIRGELKVPNPRRLYTFRKTLSASEFEEAMINEREYIDALNRGITSTEITALRDVPNTVTNHEIRRLREAGLIHPLVDNDSVLGGYRKHVLSPEEARLLIDRKIGSWLIIRRSSRTARKSCIMERERQEILGVLERAELPLPDVPESELWERIRGGDNEAFEMLTRFYDSTIYDLSENAIYGSRREDRRRFFYTALYEAILESDDTPEREEVITLLKDRVRHRARGEIPSWLSLDAYMSQEEKSDRFVDKLEG